MPVGMKCRIMGAERTLRFPIGAIEEVAEHEPRIAVLLDRLLESTYTLDDVKKVLTAAFRASGMSEDPREVIDKDGIYVSVMLCVGILKHAFISDDALKKGVAAGNEETESSE